MNTLNRVPQADSMVHLTALLAMCAKYFLAEVVLNKHATSDGVLLDMKAMPEITRIIPQRS